MARNTSFRSKCTELVSLRQSNAMDSTIYILRETGPTGYLLKEEGQPKKFKVLLGDPHTCTCPTFTKERELCRFVFEARAALVQVPLKINSFILPDQDIIIRKGYQNNLVTKIVLHLLVPLIQSYLLGPLAQISSVSWQSHLMATGFGRARGKWIIARSPRLPTAPTWASKQPAQKVRHFVARWGRRQRKGGARAKSHRTRWRLCHLPGERLMKFKDRWKAERRCFVRCVLASL